MRTTVLWCCLIALGCDPNADDGVGEEADEDDDEDEGGGHVAEVSTDECSSGRKWVGGDEESSLMHPGGDCVGCHTREGEGPRYLAAGTIYAAVDEADDCFGVAGATVEITDAEGAVWSLTTNDAGNFWIDRDEGPLAFPFRAKVVLDGTEIAMVTPQSEGSCASCHTQTGANQAVGRIFVPQ